MELSQYLAKTNPQKTLQEHTDEVLAELEILRNFGYIKSDYLYHLTKKACKYHDYGKANREFQYRIKNNKKFNETREVVHNVLSMYFVPPKDFDCVDDYCKVAEAVLNHHSYGDTNKIIEDNKKLIVDLLSDFTEETNKVEGRRLAMVQQMLVNEDALLIKGYLHRCDYSASAGNVVEYRNDFLVEKLDNMMKKWQQDGNKNIAWNPLQQFCREHTDDNLIITAQTGLGKTEAGLLWIGDHKGFFVLPIRTAINAIYDRVRLDILEMENLEERLALLHAETLSYYNDKVELESISPIEYQERSRQLCMPLTITTLDQIFDFAFKYAGYEMKLATLSYSKLVIDEIQMYGADLLAYLVYGISMITKYGGKVAILTATLSPFVRDLLVERGFSGNVIMESYVNEMVRHSLKIYQEELNAEYIIAKYNSNKEKCASNKILVVCNTVKNAQKIYQELSESIPNEELHILHNKFIKKDRSDREALILKFGRTYDENGNLDIASGVWIATSIVEASLDIDFDYLFTELSDLNGLLQRLGRCNRKGAKIVDDYNCFVFTEIDRKLLSDNGGFIDRTIYDLSKKALSEVDGILTEQDKLDLIDKYFTTRQLVSSDYMREFERAWDMINKLNPSELDKQEVDLRNIISYTIIPGCIYEENRSYIQQCKDNYENKELSLEERIHNADEIRKFTMSVESYVVNPKSKNSSKIEDILCLGKHERIYIIDCYYTELGFQKKANDGYTIW